MRRAYGGVIGFWAVSTVSLIFGLFFGFQYRVMVRSFINITVSSNLDLQLYENFHQPPSSSKSTSRPSAATEPNKSTEHRTIPKGSVHRIVVAVHVSGLLSAICNIGVWFIQVKPSSSVFLAFNYTFILVFLNSTLNPILYCWKIDEVRQVVKDTIRKVHCC